MRRSGKVIPYADNEIGQAPLFPRFKLFPACSCNISRYSHNSRRALNVRGGSYVSMMASEYKQRRFADENSAARAEKGITLSETAAQEEKTTTPRLKGRAGASDPPSAARRTYGTLTGDKTAAYGQILLIAIDNLSGLRYN